MSHSIPLTEELDQLGAVPRKRGSPERTVQVTLKRYLERVLPGVVVAAVENERKAFGATAMQRARFHQMRKASGTVAGFPDLIVDTLDQGVFYIEVKAPGGTVSEAQYGLHQKLRAHGRPVIVADSIESLRLGLQQAGIRTIEAPGQPTARPSVRVAKRKALPADAVPW